MIPRKILCCLTALLLMLTLAACAGEGAAGTSSAPGETTSAASQPDAEKTIGDYVEKRDYGGRTLTILTAAANGEGEVETEYTKNEEYADNYTDEKMAARVNDAIAERNNLVEDYLNVKIVEKFVYNDVKRPGGTMQQAVRTEILAGGSQEYQVINPCLYDCGVLAVEGALYNLYDVSTLNGLEAEWWDHSFNADVSFGDKLYFVNGDMSFKAKNATACIVYSKDVLNEYGLEDPYPLVHEGTWTVDRAIEMTKAISQDLNDDGKITYEDKVGWAGQDGDTWNLFYGSGSRIAEFDADGRLQLTMYNERSARIADKIIELVQDDLHYITADDYFGVVKWPSLLTMENFAAGNELFLSTSIADLINLQKMKGNYGLLPVPMLDETQTEYYSLVGAWSATALCIPNTLSAEDAEFAGAVLECMGYYSMDTVRKEYFDNVLDYQYVQDDASMEMLDLILSTRGCDIGQILLVGNLNATVRGLTTMPAGSFRSAYEAVEATAKADIDRLNELFEKVA